MSPISEYVIHLKRNEIHLHFSVNKPFFKNTRGLRENHQTTYRSNKTVLTILCNFELIQLVKNGTKIKFLENVIKSIKGSFIFD